MMWCECHSVLQGAILTGIFASMCLSLCILPAIFRSRNVWLKILCGLCVVLCFAAVVLFGSGMKAEYYDTYQGSVSSWSERLSFWVPVGVLGCTVMFLILALRYLLRQEKNTVTSGAIKESLDHLHTGMCFCEKNGRVILANYKMYELCQKIIGRDLQNALLFWDVLSKGQVCGEVERLSEGEQPAFRLEDGSVWSFSKTVSNGVIQLAAADVSQLQSLADDLTNTNLMLAERNLRLKAYGENVEELSRLQEQLDTKARIHGLFGQALLATRHFLNGKDENDEQVMQMWEQTADALQKVSALRLDSASLQMLQNAAVAAGLTLEVCGELPPRTKTAKLFLYAAMEALTNAVRHANAKHLRFEVTETEDMDIARFANDGNIPVNPVVEGGGLGSLRRKTELVGGMMHIETTPAFALVLTVPKEGGDML